MKDKRELTTLNEKAWWSILLGILKYQGNLMRSVYRSEKQMHNEHKLITQDEQAWWQVLLEISKAQGNLMQCFHATVNRLANVGKSLPGGNKDQLLNHARSELVKHEHQVGSLNNFIDELQQQAYAQRLELEDAHHRCMESRRERFRLQEELSMEKALRDSNPKHARNGRSEESSRTTSWLDEVSVQKLRENHETIQKLTSQFQEMQEQMNSINDSGESQQVESNHSGRLSCVPCQPAGIPSSRSMLSRDNRLPVDTWNTSGLQETFFVINFPELIRPEIIVKESIILWLHFDKFPNPHRFRCGKFDSNIKWLVVLIFHRMPCCGSKEVEMVDSLDKLKSSRSVCGKDFSKFQMLDARVASALNKIIQNSQFKKKVSLEGQKAQKEDQFLREDRSLSWSTTTFVLLALMIQYWVVLIYSLLLFTTITFKNSIRWYLGKSVQFEDKWVCATQKPYWKCTTWRLIRRYRFPTIKSWKPWWRREKDQKLRLRNFDVRHGRLETGAVVKSRKGLSGVERGKGKCYQWNDKRPVFARRSLQLPSRDPRSCTKNQNTLPPRILSQPYHEVEVCRRKNVSEA